MTDSQATGFREEREFSFTQKDFDSVRSRLNEHAGIVLSDIKQDMVYNRLARRLRVLSLTGIDQYLAMLDDPDQGPAEFVNFINALTTNLTSFFREPHHFKYLEAQLPKLLSGLSRPLKIWSAGCSIGEEPYTLAITVHPYLQGGHRARILATDIDTNVLEAGARGIYDLERVDKLDRAILRRGFLKGREKQRNLVRVRPELRELVKFRPLNLMAEWPLKGPIDVIFCRNVMIYFDKPTQRRLVDRMANLLTPNGLLFIGHSESLHNVSDRFQPVGQTIYRKHR